MSDVAALIADMVRAGVDPEIIGRTADALSQREAVLVPDQSAERRRAKDRERKRLRNSAESGGFQMEGPPPKETSPTPPKEITPTEPTTPKENPLRGQKKAVRLPSDFAPDIEWAVAEGLPHAQAVIEAAKFRDYWTGKGRDATKRDWPATWRNWVRSALERLPSARGSPTQQAPSMSQLLQVIRDHPNENQPEPQEDRSSLRPAIPYLRAAGSG